MSKTFRLGFNASFELYHTFLSLHRTVLAGKKKNILNVNSAALNNAYIPPA